MTVELKRAIVRAPMGLYFPHVKVAKYVIEFWANKFLQIRASLTFKDIFSRKSGR